MSIDNFPGERIVSYIDIVGFSNLVNRMQDEQDVYKRIMGILEKSADDLRKAKNRAVNEKKIVKIDNAQFSDNIIFTTPINDVQGLSEIAILYTTQIIATNFMLEGIFVRGGIARGWCYHNDNVILGKGYLNAYELENNVASVPRIVVDDEVVNSLNVNTYKVIKSNLLRCDSDGFWFINLFKSYPIYLHPEQLNKDLLIKARNHISLGLKESLNLGYDIKAKYRWLAKQYNLSVDEYKKDFSNLLSDVDKIDFNECVVK